MAGGRKRVDGEECLWGHGSVGSRRKSRFSQEKKRGNPILNIVNKLMGWAREGENILSRLLSCREIRKNKGGK